LELKSVGSNIIPNRALRITFKLRSPIAVEEICSIPEVRFTIDRSGQHLNYEGRFLDFGKGDLAEIGDVVKLTVLSAYPEVSLSKIANWLQLFGTIREPLSVLKDEDDIEVKNVFCRLQLKHHLPEFLPIYGAKARIYYVGQPRQCSRCHKLGHVQKDCNNDKTSWIEFINKLRRTSFYDDSLFGTWINQREKGSNKRNRSPMPFDEPCDDRREKRSDKRNNDGRDLRSHLRTKDARNRIESSRYLGRTRGRSPQDSTMTLNQEEVTTTNRAIMNQSIAKPPLGATAIQSLQGSTTDENTHLGRLTEDVMRLPREPVLPSTISWTPLQTNQGLSQWLYNPQPRTRRETGPKNLTANSTLPRGPRDDLNLRVSFWNCA